MGENQSKASGGQPPAQQGGSNNWNQGSTLSSEEVRNRWAARAEEMEKKEEEAHANKYYGDPKKSSPTIPKSNEGSPQSPNTQNKPVIEEKPVQAFTVDSVNNNQSNVSANPTITNNNATINKPASPDLNRQQNQALNHPVFKEHGQQAYLTHNLLEDVFQITFQSASLNRNKNLRLIQNADKKDDIPLFTLENFDDVIQNILESETIHPNEQKLTFLLTTHHRLETEDQLRLLDDNQVTQLRKIITSYMTTLIGSPEVFGIQTRAENNKVPLDFSSTLYDTLYTQFTVGEGEGYLPFYIQGLDENEFDTVITPLFKRILRDCNEATIENTKKLQAGIALLETILYSDKRVVEFFVNHYLFTLKGMNPNGLHYQKLTLFGACLSLNTFPDESPAAAQYFREKVNLRNADQTVKMLRTRVHETLDAVQRIMDYILKVDQKYKKSIIDWFYQALVLNEAKQKTYNMGTTVSTNGWFTNVLVLLFKLLQKMLDDPNKYPNWLTKIDLRYIKEKPLFKDVAMLNNTTNKDIEDPNREDIPKYSFLTELIFLTGHALVLQAKTNKGFLKFVRKVQDEHDQHGQQSQNFLQIYAQKLAYDVQIGDPYLFGQTLKLITFQALLILHSCYVEIVSLEDLSAIFEQTKNLKNEHLKDLPSVPTYWADNISEYVLFYRQINPSIVLKSALNFEILMDFMLSVVVNNEWILNPHLKASYTRLISSLVPQDEQRRGARDENFSFVFKQNPYYEENLIEGAVKIFVEVEKTGSSHQFYEKFSFRYEICTIINYLHKATFPFGKESYVGAGLEKMIKKHYDIYLRFVMLYLNDIIYLLDEAFTKLKSIKTFQDMQHTQEFTDLSFQDQNERNMQYEQDKSLIQTFMTFLTAYYKLGASITKASPDFFLTEEIKDKFIANLNYSIQQLNGSNSKAIKVQNMKELNFEPKFLLESITQMYLNFADREEFVRAVVYDERSYDFELFTKTASILEKYSLLGPDDTEKFMELLQRFERVQREKAEEDKFMQEITDIPDEFLDPLMNEIMKDPVLLPTSNTVMDRITINKHLLSDDTDPFNRAKLTKEMLIPQPELKARIEEFFREKRKKRAEASS